MKDRDLKRLFYDNCKNYVYVPSIFIDEIWDYLISTTGKYVGTIPVWENFCYVANEIYKGDLKRMKSEIALISDELTKYYDKCLAENFTTEKFPNNKPYTRFINLPNGRYLTFDVRDATNQSLLYYNIITEKGLDEIYSKYENKETLRYCKWITHKAFFSSIVPHREEYEFNSVKQLIIDTINSNDSIFSQFKNDTDEYFICGDKLYIPINEKGIEKYKDILHKDYIAVNGTKYFVDICEKRNIRRGDIPIISSESMKSTKVFYDENSGSTINYDLYPQIYKKITRQNVEKYDLIFGDDDVFNFFEKKIWG